MNAQFRTSFLKDLRNIRDKALLDKIRKTIEGIEKAHSLQEIADLRKLKGGSNYYRIRIGEYRIGLTFLNDTVTFVRCLNRKEIYRYFP